MQRDEKNNRCKQKQEVKLPQQLLQAKKRLESLHKFTQQIANSNANQQSKEVMVLLKEVLEVVSGQKGLYRLNEQKVVEYYDPTCVGQKDSKLQERE